MWIIIELKVKTNFQNLDLVIELNAEQPVGKVYSQIKKVIKKDKLNLDHHDNKPLSSKPKYQTLYTKRYVLFVLGGPGSGKGT